MQFKLVAMAAAVMVLAAGGARADVSLSARLSDFGYRLVDLRPDDGMAPSLELNAAGYAFSVSVGEGPSSAPGGLPGTGAFVNKGGVFRDHDAVARSAVVGRSKVAFGISGALSGRSFEWFASGHAANTRADPLQTSRFQFETEGGLPGLRMAMTVAPYTQVVWSGTLTLDGAQTLGRRGARFERSSLLASIDLLDESRETVGRLGRRIDLLPGAVDSRHDVYGIDVVFSNTDSGARQLLLEGRLSGVGESLLPVPEPGTSALMLCGFGVLAGVAGRRRRLSR